jgi:hypothetical protein
MPDKDFDVVLDYIDERAKRAGSRLESKKRRVDSLLNELGGFVLSSRASLVGKPNLLYNGNFEMGCTFDVDPLGWVFEDSFGVLLDYRYQESLAAAQYVEHIDEI